MFRKLMKWGARVSLFLFVVLSAAFLAFWAWPNLLLNTRNFERMASLLKGRGIQLSWKRVDLNAYSRSFFVKEVRFAANQLCVKMPSKGIDACFADDLLVAQIDIKGWFPTYRIPELRLSGGTASYSPVPETKKAEPQKTSENLWPSPPQFFKDVSFGKIDVGVARFEMRSPSSRIRATARLQADGGKASSQWKVSTDAEYADLSPKAEGVTRVRAGITLKSLETIWFGPYVVQGSGEGSLPGGESFTAKVQGVPHGPRQLDYAVGLTFRQGRRQFFGKIEGWGDPDGIQGSLGGTLLRAAEQVRKVSVEKCEYLYARETANKTSRRFALNCPIKITAAWGDDTPSYDRIFRQVGVLAKADFHLEDKPGAPGSLSGKADVLADSILEKAKQGKAALTTEISGDIQDFPNRLKLDNRIELSIDRFEKVVEMFRSQPWAIPEPLASLKGSLRLEAKGGGSLKEGGAVLPVQFTTRLHSASQVLNLDGGGELGLKNDDKGEMRGHFRMDLALSDVQLVLPYLEMSAPPRFFPDSRIRKPEEKAGEEEAKSGAFSYEVKIATPPNKPLRLVSNLAETPVPVAVDLALASNQPMLGKVRVQSFPVEVFKRNADIKHFNLKFGNDPDKTEVNGEVDVKYADYTIRILVLGLAQAPRVQLVNEPGPPLPQDQLIAVLLFGREVSALNDDQAQSVGNTQAALEDGALALSSMYLLASTPVESVGYNRLSGMFSAKVKLADGTSLNVGSKNFREINQIGVRKRIATNWTINTMVENPMEPVQRSVKAFLEWSKGY